ncbi:MAG: HipA N-terminal domain-containing protein [Acidobacteria bacterium]|nr:HipA N-terminal domain-containing protein [Acidobacteriota bacterium]
MTLLATLKPMRTRGARKPARFELRYAPPGDSPLSVGYLEFDGRMWTFVYDEAYKRRSDLRPIEGFDELGRVYRSTVLFPFFAVRIPDADREDVKRRLAQEQVRDPEPTDLLRLFGRRVVSSPAFELVPA